MVHEINTKISDHNGFFIYKLPQPIINIKEITDYSDDIISNSTTSIIKREISYSNDGINWSEFEHLSRQILESEKLLSYNPLHLKFKYTKLDTNLEPIEIKSLNLVYEVNLIDDDCKPKLVTEYMGLEFCVDGEFDPYVVGEAAAKLETALNGHISKAYGLKVRYFAILPDTKSTDGVLNEYSLWKETNKGGCDFKISIPNNEMPDPDLLHSEWGIDLERFEIHISPQLYEVTFGKDREPRQEDFMHIVKFNMLYYINSVKAFKGTDGILQYWVANLKKYEDNSAVEKSEETKDYLDKIVSSHEENFQEIIEEEAADLMNEQQYHLKNIENDAVREFISPDVIIGQEDVANNGTPVIRNIYDFSRMSTNQISVVYKPKVSTLTNMGLTFWVKSVDQPVNFASFNTTSVVRIDRYHVKISMDRPIKQTGLEKGLFITRNNYHYLVDEVINDDTIILFTKSKIVDGEYSRIESIKLPSTMIDDKGFAIHLINDVDLYLYLNKELYKVSSPIKPDGWYANVINISTEFSKIHWYVYEIEDKSTHTDRSSTALKLLSKSSQELGEVSGFDGHVLDAYLTSGAYKMANIRIWKKTVDAEHHNLVLNQLTVTTASLAFIIDNPDTLYLFDKLGKGNIKFGDDEPEYK